MSERELTDERKREITEKLAKWMGWEWQPEYLGSQHVKKPEHQYWDSWYPFVKLDDARLLLVECDRLGLMEAVAKAFAIANPITEDRVWSSTMRALLSTAEQQTLAVLEVVEKLNKEREQADPTAASQASQEPLP